MAKQSVIKRQLKREALVEKYAVMRKTLKQEMKTVDSFAQKLVIHTKLQPERERNCTYHSFGITL